MPNAVEEVAWYKVNVIIHFRVHSFAGIWGGVSSVALVDIPFRIETLSPLPLACLIIATVSSVIFTHVILN